MIKHAKASQPNRQTASGGHDATDAWLLLQMSSLVERFLLTDARPTGQTAAVTMPQFTIYYESIRFCSCFPIRRVFLKMNLMN